MDGIIDLRNFSGDSFVIHFGGPSQSVDAATFGQTLLGLTEALQDINREVNQGHHLDVLVDAVGPGSFRARLRAITRSAENLFSKEDAKAVLLGVLSSIIYEAAFSTPEKPPIIVVQTDAVVVEYDGATVVVSKQAMEAKKKVERNTQVKQQIANTFEALERDSKVISFGITKRMDDPKPNLEVPRALFPAAIARTRGTDEKGMQIIEVEAQLTVLKAVMQRSGRKWEFYWNGIPISAPIRDDTFFDRLISREISLRHGDTFDAILRIHKIRDPFTGAWVNDRYEVVRVVGLVLRAAEQPNLLEDD